MLLLPLMRESDLQQLAEAVQQQLQLARIMNTKPTHMGNRHSPCQLAEVPDAAVAMLIDRCLTDADAIAWAQCSRRSHQQLQRRLFRCYAPVAVALKLVSPQQRHRAAIGISESVSVQSPTEWHQLSFLPSSVHHIRLAWWPLASTLEITASTSAERLPECAFAGLRYIQVHQCGGGVMDAPAAAALAFAQPTHA